LVGFASGTLEAGVQEVLTIQVVARSSQHWDNGCATWPAEFSWQCGASAGPVMVIAHSVVQPTWVPLHPTCADRRVCHPTRGPTCINPG